MQDRKSNEWKAEIFRPSLQNLVLGMSHVIVSLLEERASGLTLPESAQR
jgi:hypothetical protein